jgi:hypothetical protein
MRALEHRAAPASLIANQKAWTEAFKQSGGTTRPWARDDIRKTLAEETSDRCAYCEGDITAVGFEEIEHYRPKSVYPNLVVEWTNLTIACARCNRNKAAKFDEAVPFVNPYFDQIADHLIFGGPIAFGASDRGDYTIAELDLNSPSRVEARNRTIETVEMLLRRRESAPAANIVRIEEVIEAHMNGPYSAAVAAYVRARST